MMLQRVLLTTVPLADAPGCIPTEPVMRALATQLEAAGHAVRVLADDAQTSGWPSNTEVVLGSITRPDDVPAAFTDITALVLAGAAPATAYQALALAMAGGATSIVNLSSHGPDFEIALPPEDWHWLAIEVIVERAGMRWNHIVPALPMAVTITGQYPLALPSWHTSIVQHAPIRRPYAHARFPYLHEADIAAAMTTVLQIPNYHGQTVHLAGVLLSDHERVHTLQDVLGLPVTFQELDRPVAAQYYQESGVEPDAISYILDTAAWFADAPATQDAAAVAQTERLIGRPRRSYADWVREHAAEFGVASAAKTLA